LDLTSNDDKSIKNIQKQGLLNQNHPPAGARYKKKQEWHYMMSCG
jgi:hypothetical protein